MCHTPAVPVEHTDDRPALQTLTHVVAFGGFVPLLAAPTYAAWLNVPLVTLLRGNDFDLGLFDARPPGDPLRGPGTRRVCLPHES